MSEPLTAPVSPVPVMSNGSPWKPVASYLHTFLIVALLCAVGVMSMLTLRHSHGTASATSLYIQTIIWLWVLSLLVYFGLPSAGISASAFVSTWMSLVLVLMAFAEEIFWAGILSIPKGQWDAARATGFGFLGTLTWIVCRRRCASRCRRSPTAPSRSPRTPRSAP